MRIIEFHRVVIPFYSFSLFITGGDEDDGIETTTNKDFIKKFLNKDTYGPKFIISTYHSCYQLVDFDIAFDFKIGDEAHHLVVKKKPLFINFFYSKLPLIKYYQ